MQCPQCHGLSVTIKDGSKKCQANNCTYMSYHVITFENQNRQFEGEKGTENRFTMIYGSQQNKQQQSKLEKNFHTSSKIIKTLASAMKLSNDIIDKAQAKLIQILRLKYPEKEKQIEQQDKQKQKQKNKDKINTSNAKIAAYSLFAACYDKKMYFKDVRIANQMGMSKDNWNQMVKDLNGKLKDHMAIPYHHLEHSVLRICQKRKIRQIQTDAMIEMVKRVKEAQIVGGSRPNTIASCIFWQIMIRSSYYNKDRQFDMRDYLRNKGGKQQQNEKWWTQTHFDCSFESIKKFKTEYLAAKLYKLIPDFQGRIQDESKIRAEKI